MDLKLQINKLIQHNNAKQSLLLLIVSLLNIILGVFINLFLSRLLGPEQFGNYSFVINLFLFAQVFFIFGFFQSGSRLIAVSHSKNESREFYGAELLILIFLYLIMTICLLLYTFFSSNIEEKHLLKSLFIAIPFGWVYLLMNYFEVLLQADNRITLLAESRLYPRILLCIILILLYQLIDYIDLNILIIIYFSSYVLTYAVVLLKIKPIFKNFRFVLDKIWQANKQFGLNIYLGSLAAVGASQLTGIVISYFGESNISVGYFAIATQLCIPLSLIPNVIATAFFQKFANSVQIDKRLIISMGILSFVSLIVVFIIAEPAILIIYGSSYVQAVSIVKYLAIGMLLYGIADFFNRFLLSHGDGKGLRNSSVVIGLTLMITNFIFIKMMGAEGAAIARIFSGIVYLSLMIFYYRVSVNKSKKTDSI